jgi:hypothetical protein
MIFHIISHLAISRQENKGHASTLVLHSQTPSGSHFKSPTRTITDDANPVGLARIFASWNI